MSSEPEKEAKKLVSVSANSILVTVTKNEAVKTVETIGAGENGEDDKGGKYLRNLARVPYNWYSITFWRKSVPVLALFNSSSEVNAIHPTFAQELRLPIRPTDVEAQKIDGATLDIYGMVFAAFSVTD